MQLDNNVTGCISPFEGLMIRTLYSNIIHRGNCAVNIGCYKGRSIQYMVDTWKYYNKSTTIYGIDIKLRDELFTLFGHNAEDIILIEGSSLDQNVIDMIPNNVEFAFIDGDHTYDGCMSDLLNFWNKLIPGGVMMVHDVFDTSGIQCQPEVYKAFFDFANIHMDEFVPDDWYCGPIHRVDSSAIVWKK